MSDRHEKWVRVEAGTVIPAGQPHAVSLHWSKNQRDGATWIEYLCRTAYTVQSADQDEWFVDSSWKPPLVLPTEPTWGIAVNRKGAQMIGKWRRECEVFKDRLGEWFVSEILDFIPLTEEQIKRIEAVR